MTEQLLDCPDVVIVLEQMGGERLAKGMARGGLGDARGTDRVLHRALENGFVEVVAATLARDVVHIEARGREDPLPRLFARGIWILPEEGTRQIDKSVLAALAVTDDDLVRREVDVFHAQPAAFQQPEAGLAHEPRCGAWRRVEDTGGS